MAITPNTPKNFSDLPAELQLQVWESTITPRAIFLSGHRESDPNPDSEDHYSDPDSPFFHSPASPPSPPPLSHPPTSPPAAPSKTTTPPSSPPSSPPKTQSTSPLPSTRWYSTPSPSPPALCSLPIPPWKTGKKYASWPCTTVGDLPNIEEVSFLVTNEGEEDVLAKLDICISWFYEEREGGIEGVHLKLYGESAIPMVMPKEPKPSSIWRKEFGGKAIPKVLPKVGVLSFRNCNGKTEEGRESSKEEMKGIYEVLNERREWKRIEMTRRRVALGHNSNW
ncbi:hypothetical protein G7Y89_g7295 [Cudoniella acicularis]|uniref:Uncharacterized protein n=1 Tax=Cudoniella acicularis TaxID=354080 RepID=A0A8H4RL34_9HELO|nr:hypothetical protein G7Y89_g7295 [Cudoniella acicularis]